MLWTNRKERALMKCGTFLDYMLLLALIPAVGAIATNNYINSVSSLQRT
jgi:hypothetical protein